MCIVKDSRFFLITCMSKAEVQLQAGLRSEAVKAELYRSVISSQSRAQETSFEEWSKHWRIPEQLYKHLDLSVTLPHFPADECAQCDTEFVLWENQSNLEWKSLPLKKKKKLPWIMYIALIPEALFLNLVSQFTNSWV